MLSSESPAILDGRGVERLPTIRSEGVASDSPTKNSTVGAASSKSFLFYCGGEFLL